MENFEAAITKAVNDEVVAGAAVVAVDKNGKIPLPTLVATAEAHHEEPPNMPEHLDGRMLARMLLPCKWTR